MSMFCKHEWKVLSETTTESQAEQFARLSGYFIKPKNSGQLELLTARKHICVVTCTKCGKLKRFVEGI